MVLLGNFQINGSAAQKNSDIKYDTFTDTGSLKYARPGTTKILEQFSYPGFNFSQAYIRSRFELARRYASQVDGLIFLMQEEVYKPSRTFQVSASSANGPSYVLEGVTIPSMPGNEDAYFVSLLQAWKNLCARLGKKAVICGSPAVCSDNAIWPYMYGSAGVSYIASYFDLIYLYHFPSTLSLAQGATCTQMNKNTGKNDAASYIKYWRSMGYRGLINYILITKFSDFPGSTDINVIRADFKSAADAGADIISTYPYANGVYSNSDAVQRMIDISNWYGGSPSPIPETWACEGPPLTGYEISNKDGRRLNSACNPNPIPGGYMNTILVLGDPHMGEASNRVAELTKDLNTATSLSPGGQIECILCTGDFEGVAKFDQAHKASNLASKPAFIIPGNHDVGSIADIKKYQGTGYPLHPGPAGTEKTSFSFNAKNIHVTMLNLYWDGKNNEGYTSGGKSGGEVGSTLLSWLRADLAAATTKYKIVCAHEPMYPDKRHKGDSLDWNIPARDALQKVLQDAGVDAFFAGHTHYARGDLISNSVLQIQDGVPGSKAGTTGDPYRSMWFIHIAANGDLVVTWKHNANSGSSWSGAAVKTWTLSQGSTPIPTGKPILTSISPTSAKVGDLIHFVVTGSNFDSGAMVDGVMASFDVPTRTATSISWTATATEAMTYHPRIRNGDGQLSDNILTFVVNPATIPTGKPVLTSITPTSALVGFYPEVLVRGSNFDSGAFPEFYRNGVFVGHGGDHVRTPTTITFNSNFKVAETLTLRVRNGDGQLSDAIIPFVVGPSNVGPVQFDLGMAAKVGLAIAFIYSLFEKKGK